MGWDITMQAQGKILTVDDDPNNITIVEELLEDDYDLKTARTGEQALEIAQDFRPDIILLDIMMPGMNGYEVCRRLREHCTLKYTKIIMISARAMVPERIEGYKAGADDYITKPFDGDEFLAKINVYMCLKRAEVGRMRYEATTSIIHELTAPLVIVKNTISDAMANVFGQISPKLRHQLEMAEKCTDRLEGIISNFLGILDICANRVELQPTQFSMQSVVLEVVSLLKPEMASRGIDLNTDMPVEELQVNADRRKMAKILGNLIDNAIELTHEGDSVCVRVKDLQENIGVDVESNGQGIESRKMDGLFGQFDQTDKRIAPGEHGRGLGLAVAKGLVELHGGRIRAGNRPEGGAVFSFEIPARVETETTMRPALSGAGADSGVRQ